MEKRVARRKNKDEIRGETGIRKGRKREQKRVLRKWKSK